MYNTDVIRSVSYICIVLHTRHWNNFKKYACSIIIFSSQRRDEILMACIPRFFAEASLTQYSIPTFLCPISLRLLLRGRICKSRLQSRSLQVKTTDRPRKALSPPSHLLSLLITCPGCGAFAQITNPNKAGFYSLKRKSVNTFLAQQDFQSRKCDSTTRNSDLGLAETRVLQDLDPNRRLPHVSAGMLGTVSFKITSILAC